MSRNFEFLTPLLPFLRPFADMRFRRCCIDKSSSAELSEAINSMFRYYERAAVCYAYLADVSATRDERGILIDLPQSDWFNRGWTLQELIAPSDLRFYSKNWEMLGTRSELCNVLHEITNIDVMVLQQKKDLSLISVSRRMSWASRRKTSRVEDIAYCLLGIFQVNMALIYGEGSKAFFRLQEEIMKTTYDHTLFLWGDFVEPPTDRLITSLLDPITTPWDGHESKIKISGLRADSPAWFSGTGDYTPDHEWLALFYRSARPPVPFAKGGHIELPAVFTPWRWPYHWEDPKIVQLRRVRIALLRCRNTKIPGCDKCVGIPLCTWGRGVGRATQLFSLPPSYWHVWENIDQYKRPLCICPEVKWGLEHGDIVFSRLLFPWTVRYDFKAYPRVAWYVGEFVIRTNGVTNGPLLCVSFGEERIGHEAAIVIGREELPSGQLGTLSIGIHSEIVADGPPEGNICSPEDRRTQTSRISNTSVMEIPFGGKIKTAEGNSKNVWGISSESESHSFRDALGWMIKVRAQRMSLSEGSGHVDVVDMMILRPDGTLGNMPPDLLGW